LEGKVLQKIVYFLLQFGYIYRWVFVGITTFLIDYFIFISIFSSYDSVYIASILPRLGVNLF
jgi:hypothetical protein